MSIKYKKYLNVSFDIIFIDKMGKKKQTYIKKTKPNKIKSIKKKEKIKQLKNKKRKIDNEIDKYINKFGKKKIENILKQKNQLSK